MDISSILSSLSPEDIDNLKSTAESLFGSEANKNTDSNIGNGMDIDPKMISKITKIMSAMNTDGGKRCKLIEALKPNLSKERQKKADDAIQILKLMELLPLISNLTDRDE